MSLKTKVLYLASLVAFMRSFAQVIYTPTQAEIVRDLSITTALFGLTISVYALGFAISQLMFGPIVDRFEGKRLLLAGLGLFSIGSLGAYLTLRLEPLLVMRTIQAIGVAAAGLVAIAMISDVIPSSERGWAMGIYEIFNAAGAAIAPIIGSVLAAWFGWRFDFLILAIIGFILLIFSAWQLPSLPVKSQFLGFADTLTIIRMPSSAGAIVLGFVMFYSLFTVFTLLPVLLTAQLELSTVRIGFLVSLLPIGAMIGSFAGGRMLDRIPVRRVILPSSLGAALSFGALTYLSNIVNSPSSQYIVAAIVLLCGVMIGYCLPSHLKIMVDNFPTMRGTASGLLIFFRFIGATAAPVITGYLTDKINLTAGFASAAVLLLIGAIVASLVVTDPKISPVSVSLD